MPDDPLEEDLYASEDASVTTPVAVNERVNDRVPPVTGSPSSSSESSEEEDSEDERQLRLEQLQDQVCLLFDNRKGK